MLTEARLREVLEALPVAGLQVEIEGRPGRLVGIVISDEFEGVDEAKRQETLWSFLLENLEERERIGLDFVFTLSKSEFTALDHNSDQETAPT